MIQFNKFSKIIPHSVSVKRFSIKSLEWKLSKEPIESAFTPPSSWYTSKEFYEKVEKQITFPNSWLLIGNKSSFKKAGDYLAGNVLGNPWVVVQTEDGQLKGHYNVCRHHAAQLVNDGSGDLSKTSNRFTCPYHGWQYTTDGRLAKATQMKGCLNFKARYIKPI
jgi:choline monooxygenase